MQSFWLLKDQRPNFIDLPGEETAQELHQYHCVSTRAWKGIQSSMTLSASTFETCLADNNCAWNWLWMLHSTFSFRDGKHVDRLHISQLWDLGILLMNKEDGMTPLEDWNAGQQVFSKTNVMYNICIRLVWFSCVVRVLPGKDTETFRALKLNGFVWKSPGSISPTSREVTRSNRTSRNCAASTAWGAERIGIDCTGGSSMLRLRNSPLGPVPDFKHASGLGSSWGFDLAKHK